LSNLIILRASKAARTSEGAAKVLKKSEANYILENLVIENDIYNIFSIYGPNYEKNRRKQQNNSIVAQ